MGLLVKVDGWVGVGWGLREEWNQVQKVVVTELKEGVDRFHQLPSDVHFYN